MGLTAVTVTGRCQGCGACLLTCPEHAIRPRSGDDLPQGGPEGPLRVLETHCTGCGECIEVCPVDAIEESGASGAFGASDARGMPEGSHNWGKLDESGGVRLNEDRCEEADRIEEAE